MHIASYEEIHLRGLQKLINVHLAAAAPGWALPEDYIADRLCHNPDEYIVDPWVIERKTFVAFEDGSIQGAVHLLRYGTEEPVGRFYRNCGSVSWLIFYPGMSLAAGALLKAAQEQMVTWRVREMSMWDQGLWIPVVGGVLDTWPHIISFLKEQGYRPHEESGQDLMFGGRIPVDLPSPKSPVDGVTLRRAVSRWGVTFDAMHGSDRIGACTCALDQTQGGRLSAFQGW
jgi:hypothetical protein